MGTLNLPRRKLPMLLSSLQEPRFLEEQSELTLPMTEDNRSVVAVEAEEGAVAAVALEAAIEAAVVDEVALEAVVEAVVEAEAHCTRSPVASLVSLARK